MQPSRTDHVLDDTGWDDTARLAAVRSVLDVVAPGVTSAETDLPWMCAASWPPDVLAAADRLRRRFAGPAHPDAYLQTGVQQVTDDEVRADFVTFAPYAYDASLWADGTLLASVNDEGTSVVVALSDAEAEALTSALGPDRIVTLRAWNERHPSVLRSLARRFRRG